jgi:hypothetical protein
VRDTPKPFVSAIRENLASRTQVLEDLAVELYARGLSTRDIEDAFRANLLEHLFVEERRRLQIIPNGFGEKPVLKLMFGALIRAAERWRGLRFAEFELRQIAAIRDDLDAEYDAKVTQASHLNRAFPANPCLDPSPHQIFTNFADLTDECCTPMCARFINT